MPDSLYAIAVIAVVTLVTWSLRAALFVLFGNRPLPRMMRYLGKMLPPSIMTVLVIYRLRNTSFTKFPFDIPEMTYCALVSILQVVRKNAYLSIIAGTICYMMLIRIL